MNVTQYRKMRTAINGATITGALYDGAGYCVTGKMMSLAGAKDIQMLDVGNPTEVDVPNRPFTYEQVITDVFGVSEDQIEELIDLNDKFRDAAERKVALRQWLRAEFPKTHKKYLASERSRHHRKKLYALRARERALKARTSHSATDLVNAVVADSKREKVKV